MFNFPPQILKAIDGLGVHATSEINAWLRAQTLRRVDPDEMVAAMVRSGKGQEMAALLVGLAQQGMFLGEHQDARVAKRVGPQSLEAAHARSHHADGGDVCVRKLISLGSLDVVVYENFLSDVESDHIRRVALARLERSTVVGPGMSSVEMPIRTSDGAFLEIGHDPIVAAVEQRIAAVTGIPAEHGEALQVLRYQGAQEYRPHFDFFEPQDPLESRKIDQAGNRVGTMILYLSDVPLGGSTYFPQLQMAIHPKRNNALWFGYMGADGVPDMRSEHAGLPVLDGEKWIATKWLRQRPMPTAAAGTTVVPFPGKAGTIPAL